MSKYPLIIKCGRCELYLQNSLFHRNSSKESGFHNICKSCMAEYKLNLKKKNKPAVEAKRKDSYFIPDIYLVGYGRCQTFQNCCLSCKASFFCIKDTRESSDLFCDDCEEKSCLILEKNKSPFNYVGNTIGWIVKFAVVDRRRSFRNYKKAYQRDGYCCQYCGYNLMVAKSFLPLHIDHIKPWSSSGGNALKNLVVSCQDCNLIAHDKWFVSFEAKKEFILFERIKKKL